MLPQPTTSDEETGHTHVLDRVLVGVDRSEASIEAARQAAVLVEPYGDLELLAAYCPLPRTGLFAAADAVPT